MIAVALLALVCMFSASEVAMSNPVVTGRAIEVEHVTIQAEKPFAEVKAALERALPALDQQASLLLRDGASERANLFSNMIGPRRCLDNSETSASRLWRETLTLRLNELCAEQQSSGSGFWGLL
jgi:hypothetical protein